MGRGAGHTPYCLTLSKYDYVSMLKMCFYGGQYSHMRCNINAVGVDRWTNCGY